MGRSLPVRPCCSNRTKAERKKAGVTLFATTVISMFGIIIGELKKQTASSHTETTGSALLHCKRRSSLKRR